MCFGGAKEVDEEAVRAGDSVGEFAKEGEAGVDVSAFAEFGVDETASQIFFAGIVHGEERCIAGVEFAPIIEATFLDPVLKIGVGDLVGLVEQWVVGMEKFDGGVLVGDARSGRADFGWVRSG